VFLDLEGVDNARDLGGIRTRDGRAVIPGWLVRSGLLADATPADARFLIEEMGLRTVIDLRNTDEASARPDPHALFAGVEFHHIPILDTSQFGVTHEGGKLRGAWGLIRKVKKHPELIMMETYERMVLDEESRRGFRRFFDVLLEAKGCVLWHCSSGKDRAGVATALVLSALGVGPDAIMEDYLLTNGHTGTRSQGVRDTLAAYHLEKRLEGSIRVLTSADERFLGAALDAMARECGSIDGYLEQALGIDASQRAALARYCG